VRWPSWLWRQVKVILTYFLVTKVARVRVPFSSAFVCFADTPGCFFAAVKYRGFFIWLQAMCLSGV
jgi:hypothetical protein